MSIADSVASYGSWVLAVAVRWHKGCNIGSTLVLPSSFALPLRVHALCRWCYSISDCYHRSKTALGSSSNIPTTVSLGGLLSSNCADSPLCNYNMVYLKYLDGNSFSGMLDKPVMFNNGAGLRADR